VHAKQTLETNKAKLNTIFEQGKQNQVDGYKKFVGNVAKEDQAILNMPPIRINATQTVGAHALKHEIKDNMRNNVKRVVPLQYTKGKPIDPKEAMTVLQTGIYDPVNAHGRFSKDHTFIKATLKSIY
jgi:hypothetical protein